MPFHFMLIKQDLVAVLHYCMTFTLIAFTSHLSANSKLIQGHLLPVKSKFSRVGCWDAKSMHTHSNKHQAAQTCSCSVLFTCPQYLTLSQGGEGAYINIDSGLSNHCIY